MTQRWSLHDMRSPDAQMIVSYPIQPQLWHSSCRQLSFSNHLTQLDQLVGAGMLAVATIVFVYYSSWTFILVSIVFVSWLGDYIASLMCGNWQINWILTFWSVSRRVHPHTNTALRGRVPLPAPVFPSSSVGHPNPRDSAGDCFRYCWHFCQLRHDQAGWEGKEEVGRQEVHLGRSRPLAESDRGIYVTN